MSLIACRAFLVAVMAVHAPEGVNAQLNVATKPVLPGIAAVSTRRLDNGLLVWHHQVPGDETVRVVLVVAGGSSLDPRGKEELAHFVEHVVFGDRPGLTERELNQQIESRGGRIAAHTNPEHTRFEVTLPAAEGSYGIRWLASLVGPREVTPALIDQQRRPIALETGSHVRRPLDRVRALYLDPAILRRPSVWRKDFGITTREDLNVDAYRALERVTAGDVRNFLRTHYVPARMTLVVTGGLSLDSTLAAAADGLGRLESAAAPELPAARFVAVQRHDRAWTLRRTASHMLSLRAHSLTASDRVQWLMLRDLLDHRLNDRLRYGARKLVYHPSVVAAMRADAAVMTAYAEASTDEVDAVRAIIEDEVAQLRAGSLPESAFVAARTAIAGRLHVAMRGRDPLADLVITTQRGGGDAEPLPDPIALYDTTSREALAAFLRVRAPVEGQGSRFVRPFRLPPAAILALAALEVLLVVRLLKRRLVHPVQMRRVRYVAGLRFDPAFLFVAALALGLPLAVGIRLAVAGIRPFIELLVVPLPAAELQLLAYALLLAMAITLLVGVGSRIPWKVLVFDDHLRLKYLSFRSRTVFLRDLAQVTLVHQTLPWLRPLGRGCLPLALLARPQLLIRTHEGPGYLLRVRDTPELAEVLERLRGTEHVATQ